MRPIIIGAGRGSRLGPNTANIPKTLVPVMGRPMLDWILEALFAAGFSRRDVVFICGYAEDRVRERYPDMTFVRNERWAENNILASLLCAREHLSSGFVSTYADIVYDGDIARRVTESGYAIALGCDTHWRRRYVDRSEHPESDAEKLRADGDRILEISRKIPSEAASGEFIGVLKMTAGGAGELVAAFDQARAAYPSGVFREGRTFEKAYLIDLLALMLEQGCEMHRVDTAGAYMEIDTEQDLASAESWWRARP